MVFAIFLIILGILLSVLLWKRKTPKSNCAPGLPVWPIVGSIPYMNPGHLHFTIHEWAKKYGQTISGVIGNEPALFVTGADNVLAALRKEEFQGRQTDLSTIMRSFYQPLGIFFSNGSHWSEARKFTLRQLRSLGSEKIELVTEKEITTLTETIKDGDIKEMNGMFSLQAANVLWSIMANKTFQPDDERFSKLMSDNKEITREGSASGSIISIYPFLRFFSKQFKINVQRIDEMQQFIRELIDDHKQILDPNHPFDLIDNYLLEMEKNKQNKKDSTFSEEDLITIIYDLFSAASEPISTAMDYFVLYMVLYPEIQKKLHEELDTVLGRSRKPEMKDRNRLPYTMAVLSEVARINPIAPMTVPHRCTKDTYFNNYFVEEGSIIFIDAWSMGHDPKYWEKPEEFLPERFLDSEGNYKKSTIFHPFGIGQRVCIGDGFTRSITFLFMTTFFEKYIVSLPKGEPRPSTYPLPGFTVSPQTFKALIKTRY